MIILLIRYIYNYLFIFVIIMIILLFLMCFSRVRDWLINIYFFKLNFRMFLVKGLFVLLLIGKFCKIRWKEFLFRFGRVWKV